MPELTGIEMEHLDRAMRRYLEGDDGPRKITDNIAKQEMLDELLGGPLGDLIAADNPAQREKVAAYIAQELKRIEDRET